MSSGHVALAFYCANFKTYKMYMRVLFISLLALTVSLAACTKLRKAFNITITVPYDDVVTIAGIPGDPHVGSGLKASLALAQIPTNSKEILEDNETALSLVTSVNLSELKVDMLLPTNQDFGIMDSVWIYLSANGVSEKLAAYNYNVTDTGRSIVLTPTDADLKDVFIADTMKVRIEAFFVKDVSRTNTLKFNMKLKVNADLLD